MAHEWLSNVYEPVISAIPQNLTGRLEPAEIFHEVLEHRWYVSERAGKDVPLVEAVNSYVNEILVARRDEEAIISPTTESITLAEPIPSGTIQVEDEDEEEDWRDKV